MNDRTFSSGKGARNDASPSRSHRDVVGDLSQEIAELKAIVADLKASREVLETDHQRLQDENHQLRREMTLAHLIEDLQAVVEEELADLPSTEAPSPAQRFYDQLPDRFRFACFFQMADEADLEATQARQFLVRYLADERLVQAGAYLEKGEDA